MGTPHVVIALHCRYRTRSLPSERVIRCRSEWPTTEARGEKPRALARSLAHPGKFQGKATCPLTAKPAAAKWCGNPLFPQRVRRIFAKGGEDTLEKRIVPK